MITATPIFALKDDPGTPGPPGPWECPVYLPVERAVVLPLYELSELTLGVSDAGLLDAGVLLVLGSILAASEGLR